MRHREMGRDPLRRALNLAVAVIAPALERDEGRQTVLMPLQRELPGDVLCSGRTGIAAARRNAADAGRADRVTFRVGSATAYPGNEYGLICFFDCLHDMGDPVGAAN